MRGLVARRLHTGSITPAARAARMRSPTTVAAACALVVRARAGIVNDRNDSSPRARALSTRPDEDLRIVHTERHLLASSVRAGQRLLARHRRERIAEIVEDGVVRDLA